MDGTSSCVPARCSRGLPLDGHRVDVQRQRRTASCHPRSAVCGRAALCASGLGEQREQHLVRVQGVHDQHAEHHEDSAEECQPWGQQRVPSLLKLHVGVGWCMVLGVLAAPALASSASHTASPRASASFASAQQLGRVLLDEGSMAERHPQSCQSPVPWSRSRPSPQVAVGPSFEVSTKSPV